MAGLGRRGAAPKNEFTTFTALMVGIGAIATILGDFVHARYLAPIGMGIGALGIALAFYSYLRSRKRS